MGRWSWIQFNNRKGKKTIVISAYSVFENQHNAGVHTYYSQLRQLQNKEEGDQSPCSIFWRDLTSYVSSLHNNDISVIMGIDANSDLNCEGRNIRKFMQSTGMVEVIRKISPEKNNTPTFVRGQKRIDGILMSSSLCSSLIHASHIDTNNMVETDHIEVTATLNKNKFCNTGYSYSTKTKRTVTITNPHNIIAYNDQLLRLIKIQRLHHKLLRIKNEFKLKPSSHQLSNQFNIIDKHICQLQRNVEKNYQIPFFPTLVA